MIISLKTSSVTLGNDFQQQAVERISKSLARLAHRITSVNVTLTDENGPRGGIDKQCRVSVTTLGLGRATASARNEDPMEAVRLATRRARRMILTRLKRPAAVYVRRHNQAIE